MEFFATCPAGFEQALSREMKALHIPEVRPLRGQVAFAGDLSAAYTVCLWSRLASRVVLVLDRIDAANSDELYEGLHALSWEDHLSPGTSILVDASGTNDQLRNSRFVAQRTKDALGDRMVERRGTRLRVDIRNPDVRIVVRLRDKRATVGIDLTGAPLFERGYEHGVRRGSGPHDLRPDYAAFLLSQLGWGQDSSEAPLIIPFVGSGSIAVEACAMASGSAAGLLRTRWGFLRWAGHDASLWSHEVGRATALAEQASYTELELQAFDIRAGFEAATRSVLRAASIDASPTFSSEPAALACNKSSYVACDLSWIRPEELALEARALGVLASVGASAEAGSHVAVLARDSAPDAALMCEPSATVSTIVGSAEATCRSYELADAPAARPELAGASVRDREIPVLVETSDQFARRLAKALRLKEKWARREGISCYRIYDSDLPDYAVAIDYYLTSPDERFGRTRPELVIAEYAAPKEIDPEIARRRLLDVLALAPEIFKVDPRDVHVKVRSRSKGGSQYADTRQKARTRFVEEGGLVFEVALDGHLDTGIFLDNRETRSMIRELAKPSVSSSGELLPKSFLNLFAYTGTATCYVADGGASSTTTVDMSQPYLDWAQRNMRHNGFDGAEHHYVRADVLKWVSEQRRMRGHERYDLVFCEPPTFSNSSKMRRQGFDVQRDHVQLLIDVSRLLAPGGVCVFSNNLRNFRPDVEGLARAGVEIEDITPQTIPEDFARTPKIHHCYLVRRTST